MRLQISGGTADTRPVSGSAYNAPELDQFALATEQHYGLPPGLILAVKNAGERSNSDQVSPKGAKGVMQFIDDTRAAYPHDSSDPKQSIDAAGRYFVDLLHQYRGNPMAALAHYNGGGWNAQDVLAGRPPRSPETRAYLDRVRQYLSALAG